MNPIIHDLEADYSLFLRKSKFYHQLQQLTADQMASMLNLVLPFDSENVRSVANTGFRVNMETDDSQTDNEVLRLMESLENKSATERHMVISFLQNQQDVTPLVFMYFIDVCVLYYDVRRSFIVESEVDGIIHTAFQHFYGIGSSGLTTVQVNEQLNRAWCLLLDLFIMRATHGLYDFLIKYLPKCNNETTDDDDSEPHYYRICRLVVYRSDAEISVQEKNKCFYLLSVWFLVTAMNGGFRNYNTAEVDLFVMGFYERFAGNTNTIDFNDGVKRYMDSIKNKRDEVYGLLLGLEEQRENKEEYAIRLRSHDGDDIINIRTARIRYEELKGRDGLMTFRACQDEVSGLLHSKLSII